MFEPIFKNRNLLNALFTQSQSFLAGMLGALIILLMVQWMTPPPKMIATIDITKLTQDFIKKAQAKNLTDDFLKKETIIFGKQLEKNIKQFAEHNHLVLLPQEAVMAGSNDYTQEISRLMEESMLREEGTT